MYFRGVGWGSCIINCSGSEQLIFGDSRDACRFAFAAAGQCIIENIWVLDAQLSVVTDVDAFPIKIKSATAAPMSCCGSYREQYRGFGRCWLLKN